MAETIRGGLSLTTSGFAFSSHDIGGFEVRHNYRLQSIQSTEFCNRAILLPKSIIDGWHLAYSLLIPVYTDPHLTVSPGFMARTQHGPWRNS